jgi:glucan phosphoethanolaminetransferase (alkaline phosphatase superfamily)
MIQRIQTIYLALVVVCLALVFVFPFATYTIGENSFVFNVMGFDVNGTNKIRFPFYLGVSVVILLSIITIAKYKKRTTQLKIGRINYLILLAVIALSFVNVRTIEDNYFANQNTSVSFGAGLFLPVAALAFLFLANRGIKKDEELIKSLDRLR